MVQPASTIPRGDNDAFREAEVACRLHDEPQLDELHGGVEQEEERGQGADNAAGPERRLPDRNGRVCRLQGFCRFNGISDSVAHDILRGFMVGRPNRGWPSIQWSNGRRSYRHFGGNY